VVCGKSDLTCGRNTNNPRWLYINVDDNPNPFPELRRLLDHALAYDYGDRSYKLLEQGKSKEALADAEKSEHYAPDSADTHLSLGFLTYLQGDKTRSLEEFQKAKQMDTNFRKQFEAEVSFEKKFAPILNDKDFLQKIFPEGLPTAPPSQ